MSENTIKVEVSGREAWNLMVHVKSGAYSPSGHEEFQQLRETLAVFGMLDAYEDLLQGMSQEEAAGLAQKLSVRDKKVLELPRRIINFFLEKVSAGKMHPELAIVLSPLIERLKDAKRGEYKAPE
jgi:hypothetical protein